MDHEKIRSYIGEQHRPHVEKLRAIVAGGGPKHQDEQREHVERMSEIAAHVNSQMVDVNRPIAMHDVVKLLVRRGIYANIVQQAGTGHAQSIMFLDMVRLGIVGQLDLTTEGDRELLAQMLPALVPASVLEDIKKLAVQTVPAWTQIAGREIDHGDIIVALGHTWEDLSIPNPKEEEDGTLSFPDITDVAGSLSKHGGAL